METPLPNFQHLEERIKQLSETLRRIRESSINNKEASEGLPKETKYLIEKKINNLIEMIEEF